MIILFWFDEILIEKFATAHKCQLVVDYDVLIMVSDCIMRDNADLEYFECENNDFS